MNYFIKKAGYETSLRCARENETCGSAVISIDPFLPKLQIMSNFSGV